MSDYTVAESFVLPSNGLVYRDVIDPHVKLRAMTVRDEMKRLAPVNDGTIYKSMADIIDGCLVEKPGISAYDMCVGDFQFLMHKLRIVTYGPEYQISCRCSNCGDVDDHTVNLETLELNEVKEFDREKELTLKLPASGRILGLTVTTPRILDNIEKEVIRVNKQYKKQHADPSELDWRLLYQLCYAIDTVDGQRLSLPQKEAFCNGLVGRDFNAIINKLSDIDEKVGLGALLEVHCNKCGADIITSFRVTSEFFRPTNLG